MTESLPVSARAESAQYLLKVPAGQVKYLSVPGQQEIHRNPLSMLVVHHDAWVQELHAYVSLPVPVTTVRLFNTLPSNLQQSDH